MSQQTPFRHERLLELLCDRALTGLSPAEESELATLSSEYPGTSTTTLDLVASSVDLALLRGRLEPMPASLAQKIENAASTVTPLRRPESTRRDFVRWSGWVAAAASLALAVAAWRWRIPGGSATATKSPAEERQALLARADAKRIDWKATPDPAAREVSGDVVFSVAEQRGYMRFKGLAANNPTQQQYQLWIFDKTQDERFPIDGGVFDVDAKTGDVIVPIRAKLRVTEPTLFAVTIERPGGVVVSKRERIVVTAAST